MTWVAVGVGVGGMLVGGTASYLGSQSQAKAAKHAADVTQAEFGAIQQQIQPWMLQGGLARQGLTTGLGLNAPGGYDPNAPLMRSFNLGDFQQSPAYQFNLQQGQQAIDKASAARGNFYAPQTLQDMSKFSQGLASNEFWNAQNAFQQQQQAQYGRLAQVSGSGQNAAANLGSFGMESAGMAGGFGTDAAAAQAGGYAGIANSINAGLGTGYNAWLTQQLLRQANTPATYEYGASNMYLGPPQ